MAYTPKDMSGTLFQNERATSDKHPQWKGTILIAGQEYWISGWDKDAGRGPFISLSVQVKEPKAQRQSQAPRAPAPAPDAFDVFDDPDIPF